MLRAGTVLAFTGLVMSFALSWYLQDATAFVVLAPVAVGGKWAENIQERRTPKAKNPQSIPTPSPAPPGGV